MKAKDYRAEARRKLQGKWGKAIGIEFAFYLVIVVIQILLEILPDSLGSIVSIGFLVVEIPLVFGIIISFVKLFNGDEVKAFDYFTTGFDNFGKSWGIAFFTFLKLLIPFIVVFVSVILMVSGLASSATSIIMSRAYNIGTAQATHYNALTIIGFIGYIVGYIWLAIESYYYKIVYMVGAEYENLSSKEIVEKSKELMTNRRWRLFCLELSFIGWIILAALTFGIGLIWLAPYMEFAQIAFYKDAKGEISSPEVEEPITE